MSTTTTSLAGLIPHELMSGVLQQSMGDQANLLDICNVRTGFVAYKFAELNNLTAAGVTEGAALVPATVTPESVRIVAEPQEVPAIQITNLAMETQEVDWINLSGALGKALGDRANALVCATFDDTFGAAGVRECANSSDGGGNPAAMDIQTLELALEIAEGNNKLSKSFGSPGNLAFVLHPSQVSALRAAVRASSNYISREDILATFPALSGNGVAFGYYGVPIISSAGVVSSGFVSAAGGGTELQTGVALAAGNTRKGALVSIEQAIGFVLQKEPNIRMEETALIGTGGMNAVAGMVGQAARISHQLVCVQSA